MSMPEGADRSERPELKATLEKDGYEIIELPLKGPSLLPMGLMREFLRPSTNMTNSGLFLSYDPQRAERWKGTLQDADTRRIQAGFFAKEGYTQLETQNKHHVVAVRTKPQESPEPAS